MTIQSNVFHLEQRVLVSRTNKDHVSFIIVRFQEIAVHPLLHRYQAILNLLTADLICCSWLEGDIKLSVVCIEMIAQANTSCYIAKRGSVHGKKDGSQNGTLQDTAFDVMKNPTKQLLEISESGKSGTILVRFQRFRKKLLLLLLLLPLLMR